MRCMYDVMCPKQSLAANLVLTDPQRLIGVEVAIKFGKQL